MALDQGVDLRRRESRPHGHGFYAGNARRQGDRLGRALGMNLDGAATQERKRVGRPEGRQVDVAAFDELAGGAAEAVDDGGQGCAYLLT
jgi:hypothetical protein